LILRTKEKKIRLAAGWVLSGAGLPGQVKCRAPAKIQENSSKANTPFGVVGTCGPRVEVSHQKIKFYHPNPPQGATFVCCTFVNSQSIYPLLVGWTLWALGWGELPRNNILHTNPPEEQLLFPYPCLMHNPSGNFRQGHIRGYPGGQHFRSPPSLVPRLGEMKSPCQISG